MRQAWTDERLDDLSGGMHREFARVHEEFARVHEEFGRVHQEFGWVHEEFRILRGELNALHRTMILGFGSIVASVIGSVAAVLVAHAL